MLQKTEVDKQQHFQEKEQLNDRLRQVEVRQCVYSGEATGELAQRTDVLNSLYLFGCHRS